MYEGGEELLDEHKSTEDYRERKAENGGRARKDKEGERFKGAQKLLRMCVNELYMSVQVFIKNPLLGDISLSCCLINWMKVGVTRA